MRHAPEDDQTWDGQEDVGLEALHLLLEYLVLRAKLFDADTKTDEL
jgi:hypothetical protein